jgi:hypothetical protein
MTLRCRGAAGHRTHLSLLRTACRCVDRLDEFQLPRLQTGSAPRQLGHDDHTGCRADLSRSLSLSQWYQADFGIDGATETPARAAATGRASERGMIRLCEMGFSLPSFYYHLRPTPGDFLRFTIYQPHILLSSTMQHFTIYSAVTYHLARRLDLLACMWTCIWKCIAPENF